MKTCPRCNSQVDDAAPNCWNCGMDLTGAAPSAVPPYAMADPADHTASFDPRDISDNKVIAMVIYLFGMVGILFALIGSKESPYVGFHVRQALKISVCAILNALLMFTIIWIPFGMIVSLILLVVRVLCFFQICSGKAKEPPIVRSLGFLK